jgi:hypothetical protein
MRSVLRPAGVRWLGHTFTAGKTGLLTHVELYLFVEMDGVGVPDAATVEIQTTDPISRMPSGSVIATATTSLSDTSPAMWYDFVFATPPQVTAGTRYAIVVTGAPDGGSSWYYTNPYTGGGQNLVNQGSGWTVTPNSGRAFRTYVFPGPALHWSATSMVAGTTATLTLTETFTFPGVVRNVRAGAQPAATGPYYIEQVALPSWFTVTGASCSSQVNVTCDATSFLAGATLDVTPDGNPITVTLTGTASPPAGAAGTKGTVTGQTCLNPSGTPTCAPASADISILAPGATPPPSTTGSGDEEAPDTIAWLLPAALIALLGATFVSMRRGQSVR